MNNTPAFQNIPSPKTVDGQQAARAFKAARGGDFTHAGRPIPKEYRTSFDSFMTQMRSASEASARAWQRFLDEGYVEVAPGILRHPDTGTTVERG